MTNSSSNATLDQIQPGATMSLLLVGGPDTAHQAVLQLAQRLNCDGRHASQPCASCRRFAAGTQTVCQTITPGDKASIGIEPIRGLLKSLALAPARGDSTRVISIEPADALTTEAQNGLLKTLEEPPAQTVMVLVTRSPRALLETVRSRCQLVPLDQEATAAIDVAGLVQANPFNRLLAVKNVIDAKTDTAGVITALHHLTTQQAAQLAPADLRRRMAALEQCRRQLAAGVTNRAALESLTLQW